MIEFLFAPILSLFSPRFYRDILKSSLAKGFFYLAYLAVIFATVFLVILHVKFIPIAENFVDWFALNLPEITFEKGTVSSPAKQPYEMKHPVFGKILVLDTTKDALKTEELKDIFFYITKTKIYANDYVHNEIRIFDLTAPQNQKGKLSQGPQTLTGKSVKAFYLKAKPFFLILFFFLFGASIFFWKLGAALFYSLLALVLNRFREEKFSYAVLLNVSIFGLTAVSFLQLLNFIVPHLHLGPPLWMALVITTLYLGLGLLIVSPPEKSPEP